MPKGERKQKSVNKMQWLYVLYLAINAEPKKQQQWQMVVEWGYGNTKAHRTSGIVEQDKGN